MSVLDDLFLRIDRSYQSTTTPVVEIGSPSLAAELSVSGELIHTTNRLELYEGGGTAGNRTYIVGDFLKKDSEDTVKVKDKSFVDFLEVDPVGDVVKNYRFRVNKDRMDALAQQLRAEKKYKIAKHIEECFVKVKPTVVDFLEV